jgi:hypothetical protein
MWRIELSPELRRGRNRIELHGEGVVRFHDLHIVNENGALLPVEADPALAQVHPSRLYAGLDWSLAQGPLGLTVDIE